MACSWSVPKYGMPATNISSFTMPSEELLKQITFTGSWCSLMVSSSPMSMPNPPSPDQEMTWRSGYAACTPIAIGRALAMVP